MKTINLNLVELVFFMQILLSPWDMLVLTQLDAGVWRPPLPLSWILLIPLCQNQNSPRPRCYNRKRTQMLCAKHIKLIPKKNCSVWKLTFRKPISLEAKLIHVENLSELILRGHQLLYSQGISDNCFQGRLQQNDFIHWCQICEIWNTPT